MPTTAFAVFCRRQKTVRSFRDSVTRAPPGWKCRKPKRTILGRYRALKCWMCFFGFVRPLSLDEINKGKWNFGASTPLMLGHGCATVFNGRIVLFYWIAKPWSFKLHPPMGCVMMPPDSGENKFRVNCPTKRLGQSSKCDRGGKNSPSQDAWPNCVSLSSALNLTRVQTKSTSAEMCLTEIHKKACATV